jgi:8-hydroxy-5-deazaflavin:NADPH oxidoreductase
MMKQTIAIIGTEDKSTELVARKLAAAGYSLLLFAKDEKRGKRLLNEIRTAHPTASLDHIGCEFHASWEADMIFITTTRPAKDIAEKISQVATRKLIVNFNNANGRELQGLLPDSKIVNVKTNGADPAELFIAGDDEEAVQTVTRILQEIEMTRTEVFSN